MERERFEAELVAPIPGHIRRTADSGADSGVESLSQFMAI